MGKGGREEGRERVKFTELQEKIGKCPMRV
jgi:hypothetical protein